MTTSAESIRQRMQQVRRDLGEDMDDIRDSTRTMMDWRSYLKRYPWICLGAALAAGFVIVPKRVELISPDLDALLELAKRNKLVVKTNPKAQARSGLSGTVLTFLGNAVVRAGIAYAGQHLGTVGGQEAASDSD